MKALANHEAEREILASLSNESATHPELALKLLESSRLAPVDFSLPECADTFAAIQALLARGSPVELIGMEAILAVSPAVKKAGGRKFLTDVIMHPTATAATIPEHARLVRDLSSRRLAIDALRRSAMALQDTALPLGATLNEAQTAWGAIVARKEGLGTAEGDIFTIGEQLDAVQQGRREPVLPTGIPGLDQVIGGLQPTLTILGALPGVGKSALIAAMLQNISNAGKRVGLFSLEDERTWFAKRILAAASAVPLFVLCNKKLTPKQRERVDDAGKTVYDTLSRVVIDDRIGLTPSDVVAGARDMILNHGVKAIFVDHLGELRYSRTERFDLDIAEALSGLRGIAKQYGVPVLVACHVKRREGLTVDKEPLLTDFANSSAIERMARIALALSRAGDRLRVSVLKQTNGQAGVSVELGITGPAGVVRSEKSTAKVGYEEDEKTMLAEHNQGEEY